MEISVAEGVQENDQKDSDAHVVEALDPEDYEASLFQLVGYSDLGKYNPSKKERVGEN